MKPNTYTQFYIHLVFSPKATCPITSINHQIEIHKYISGFIDSMGHKSLGVNGIYDHIHILYGMKPDISVSDTIKEIKRVSTTFIRERFLLKKFNWQNGYGGFSYSRSQIGTVIEYIKNQREHHQKYSFEKEYKQFLRNFEIEYQDEFLFDFSHLKNLKS